MTALSIFAEHLSARQLIMHLKLLCVCMSVRPSVRPSVHPSVRPSICPSVCPFITIKGMVGDDTYGTQQQMRFISFNYDISSLCPFPLCGCRGVRTSCTRNEHVIGNAICRMLLAFNYSQSYSLREVISCVYVYLVSQYWH